MLPQYINLKFITEHVTAQGTVSPQDCVHFIYTTSFSVCTASPFPGYVQLLVIVKTNKQSAHKKMRTFMRGVIRSTL